MKIADFGASKRSTHTALRTRCGTDGYIAPELLGLLGRKFSNGEEFSFALDMWSLGCLVYELLTSQKVFCEVGESETDLISGLDTSLDIEEPQVNMELLFDYCAGRAEFPSAVLRESEVPGEASDLVQSLLVANPKLRATACGALQSKWLTSIDSKNTWFKQLEAEFSELGIELDVGTRPDKALMRQIRTIDVSRFLPTSTVNKLPALLEQAVDKGLRNAAWMLVNSPGRIVKDPSGVQRLFEQGIRERRCGWVTILLEVGNNLDVNSAGRDGRTAVEVAVSNGWSDILCLLIKNNARVDTEADSSLEGRTPLQAAVGRGDVTMVQLLLRDCENIEKMINASPAKESGRTALQSAAEIGHLALIQLLISNGADINASPASVSGRTALQAAAENGHLDVAILLLRNHAKVDTHLETSNGTTALRAAASNGHLDMVRLLLEQNAVVGGNGERDPGPQTVLGGGPERQFGEISHERSNRRGNTALQAAVESGHVDIVRLLFACNFNVYHGAVFTAVRVGRIDLVGVLLENKCNVDDYVGGKTALHVAVEDGRLDMVRLLLRYSPSFSDQIFRTTVGEAHIDMITVLLDKFALSYARGSITAMQIAVESSRLDVVLLLLQYNATITDEAFYESIRRGQMDTIRLLLVNKANVNTRRVGSTALRVAVDSGNLEVVNILLDHSVHVNGPAESDARTALQLAAGNGNLNLVKLLIRHHADINAEPAGQPGRTALQAAADGGHIDVAKFLLESGADVNGRPAFASGRTALQAASGNGHSELVKLLVSLKAKINAEPAPQSGRTALQAAAGGGHQTVVIFLLSHRAKVNAGPAKSDGMTALQAAFVGKHHKIVELLKQSGAMENLPPNPTTMRLLRMSASDRRKRSRKSLVKFIRRTGIVFEVLYGFTAIKLLLLCITVAILGGIIIGIPVYAVFHEKQQ